jgi:hypothetical protein
MSTVNGILTVENAISILAPEMKIRFLRQKVHVFGTS